MKKLSSENLLGMHGVEDAGSVENFGAIITLFNFSFTFNLLIYSEIHFCLDVNN